MQSSTVNWCVVHARSRRRWRSRRRRPRLRSAELSVLTVIMRIIAFPWPCAGYAEPTMHDGIWNWAGDKTVMSACRQFGTIVASRRDPRRQPAHTHTRRIPCSRIAPRFPRIASTTIIVDSVTAPAAEQWSRAMAG